MDEQKVDILLLELKKILIDLDFLNIESDYSIKLLKWYVECSKKNYFIHDSKKDSTKTDQEAYTKQRGNVYWTDLGMNIGSEFNNWHFSVVLKETKYTALIAPLTSKKADIPQWITEDDGIVDIGAVIGFPMEEKECYACTSFIRSVSKKRLSKYGNKKDGYINLKLTSSQLDLIDKTIKNRFINPI